MGCAVDPRLHKPLINEVHGITNDILLPYKSTTKPPYSECILPVPWPLVISKFHCIERLTSQNNWTPDCIVETVV